MLRYFYAHGREGQEQFFRYGFGMRCVDAIRKMDVIEISHCIEYEFVELSKKEYSSVYQLDQFLNQHQCESPFFMNRKPVSLQEFINSYEECNSRFFVAKHNGKICAYLKILKDGETFIVDDKDYIHIGGAFCLPEHRGKGVYPNLLNHVIQILREEGYSRFGVDFESINPNAWGFWLKYFDAYTHSLVRRIDENVLITQSL
ncbi:MAG: GNAT family N-acetyltransferase [Clostridiales bacterium]|nr:GNAT family N-acetyltransferase [Clostridiales bacterium]